MSREITHLVYLYDRMREDYFNSTRTDVPKKRRLLYAKSAEMHHQQLSGALDVIGLDGLMLAGAYFPIIEKKAKRAVRSR
jgi:hypothetical protein